MSDQVTLPAATSRLYRCYKVVSTMLHKRGYAVLPSSLSMTPAQFKAKFGMDPDRSGMTIMVEKSDQSGQKVRKAKRREEGFPSRLTPLRS